MSTQNDLLDGNNSNLERLSNEAPEQSDMCLNWQDDVDNNFPNCEPDARGMRDTAPTDRYVKLLDFTHFSRHMVFSKSERKDKKKAILNGVNVSVVLDLVCAAPKKYS